MLRACLTHWFPPRSPRRSPSVATAPQPRPDPFDTRGDDPHRRSHADASRLAPLTRRSRRSRALQQSVSTRGGPAPASRLGLVGAAQSAYLPAISGNAGGSRNRTVSGDLPTRRTTEIARRRRSPAALRFRVREATIRKRTRTARRRRSRPATCTALVRFPAALRCASSARLGQHHTPASELRRTSPAEPATVGNATADRLQAHRPARSQATLTCIRVAGELRTAHASLANAISSMPTGR